MCPLVAVHVFSLPLAFSGQVALAPIPGYPSVGLSSRLCSHDVPSFLKQSSLIMVWAQSNGNMSTLEFACNNSLTYSGNPAKYAYAIALSWAQYLCCELFIGFNGTGQTPCKVQPLFLPGPLFKSPPCWYKSNVPLVSCNRITCSTLFTPFKQQISFTFSSYNSAGVEPSNLLSAKCQNSL